MSILSKALLCLFLMAKFSMTMVSNSVRGFTGVLEAAYKARALYRKTSTVSRALDRSRVEKSPHTCPSLIEACLSGHLMEARALAHGNTKTRTEHLQATMSVNTLVCGSCCYASNAKSFSCAFRQHTF